MDPIRSGLFLARNLTLRGFPTVLVGGAVRDLLLGLPPRDADLATAAPPEILEDLFPSLRRLDRPGGTTFLLPGPGGIHETTSLLLRTLEEDLARRDLTVNALALDPSGTLLDPWGGREDLAAGRLRFTGSGEARLREDPLRALRLARFAAQLSGFVPTPEAIRSCRTLSTPLSSLPSCRRGGELWRALASRPEVFLRWIRAFRLEDPYPGLLPRSLPPLPRLRRACPRTPDPVVRLAALLEDLHPRGLPAPKDLLLPLGFPREASRTLLRLLALPGGPRPDAPETRRGLRAAPPEVLRLWLALDALRPREERAPQGLREAPAARIARGPRPPLSPRGQALLDALPPQDRGPLMEAAEDRVFLGKADTLEEALRQPRDTPQGSRGETMD